MWLTAAPNDLLETPPPSWFTIMRKANIGIRYVYQTLHFNIQLAMSLDACTDTLNGKQTPPASFHLRSCGCDFFRSLADICISYISI